VCTFFRDLQAAYALRIVGGDTNLRESTGTRSVPTASRFSGSSRQRKRALEDDLSFAQSVHAAWMNQFGDPAAAVAALQSVLRSFSDSGTAMSRVDSGKDTGIENLDTSSGISNDRCEVITADESLPTHSQLVERIARYNSSTLLRLLQQRAGVAMAAGRAEASNYLQILRRHNLADVYHYTIVLNSCCERLPPLSFQVPLMITCQCITVAAVTKLRPGVSVLLDVLYVVGKKSEVDALVVEMSDDGVEYTAATKRTLATVRRRLSG
jgi:hypothetical protein